jgi:hypothetical protein
MYSASSISYRGNVEPGLRMSMTLISPALMHFITNPRLLFALAENCLGVILIDSP